MSYDNKSQLNIQKIINKQIKNNNKKKKMKIKKKKKNKLNKKREIFNKKKSKIKNLIIKIKINNS